jgi:hypothetical protein
MQSINNYWCTLLLAWYTRHTCVYVCISFPTYVYIVLCDHIFSLFTQLESRKSIFQAFITLHTVGNMFSEFLSRTTDTQRLNSQFFMAQIQIIIPNKYLECGYEGLVFCRNNGWIMENMDKGLTVPTLVTQPMMQRWPNPMELRSMDSYIQILCRFQKSKRKVPRLSPLSTKKSPNAPEFIYPICLPKPKRSEFQWKASSLGVRSLWLVSYWQQLCETRRGQIRVGFASIFYNQSTMQSRFSDIKLSNDLFFKDHFSIYYIMSFDLVTVFAETKSVTKSRLHCTDGS